MGGVPRMAGLKTDNELPSIVMINVYLSVLVLISLIHLQLDRSENDNVAGQNAG
jgi:hypothetical protein